MAIGHVISLGWIGPDCTLIWTLKTIECLGRRESKLSHTKIHFVFHDKMKIVSLQKNLE